MKGARNSLRRRKGKQKESIIFLETNIAQERRGNAYHPRKVWKRISPKRGVEMHITQERCGNEYRPGEAWKRISPKRGVETNITQEGCGNE